MELNIMNIKCPVTLFVEKAELMSCSWQKADVSKKVIILQ